MKSERNKILAVVLGIIVIGILIVIVNVSSQNDRLSEEEIFELRESYPMSDMSYPLGRFKVRSLDQLIEKGIVCSFVYGEVIGNATTYFEEFSLGNEIMDMKLEKNGLDKMEFFEYQISVIEDTEERYQEGDIVTIFSNAIHREAYPKFSNGMKVIIPLVEGEETPFRDTYAAVGTYYVTEKGYVISAYDENEYANTTYSGLRVNSLLEDLKELIK